MIERVTDVPDERLLERWRAGDQAAGHRLFSRHSKAIVRFFETKARTDHEDLVQSTFLACLAGRDQIRDASRFRGYLFGVAYRTLADHYRRGHGGIDVTQRSMSSMCDPGPSPASQQAHGEARDRVQTALQGLPLEMQTVLELYYWEELTAPEVAEATGLAEGTVRSRIRRGLERLTTTLSREQDTPLRDAGRCEETLRLAAPRR